MGTVDPLLQEIIVEALAHSPYDFGVTSGYRTAAEQMQHWKNNKSKLNGIRRSDSHNGIQGTGISRHQQGLAVDLVIYIDGKVSWEFDYYSDLNDIIQDIAIKKGAVITWGGSWPMKDGPHWEIYP